MIVLVRCGPPWNPHRRAWHVDRWWTTAVLRAHGIDPALLTQRRAAREHQRRRRRAIRAEGTA